MKTKQVTLLEYHRLNMIGTYFICLVAYSKGKGSYKIYYNNELSFNKRLKYLQKELEKRGYEIYKISKIQKEGKVTDFVRRIYFKKLMNGKPVL